jgi:decaprenyl-phosphate phosphoribosyltransferase
MKSTESPTHRDMSVVGLIRLMRPKQWIKNGFVLAPLIFAGKFLDPSAITNELLATLLFCLAASATYVINDIQDVERDRQHPIKRKKRPIANGSVSVPQALGLLLALYAGIGLGAWVMPKVVMVLIGYMLLNIAYSFYLKHQPVLDIFTIAIGFVLRVFAGAVALDVPVSSWMFITTLCLALYLAAIKRRQELNQNGTKGRKILEQYSVALIDRYAEMSATGALVFYSLFVMSTKPQMVITIPLVLFGLFRYWYVTESLDGGQSPTDELLADRQLLLTVALWIGSCAWALWP